MNSLIANDSLEKISSFQISFEIFNPDPQSEHSLLFALSDYRVFYAFRFSGDGTRLNKLQFINSTIKDTTLRPAVKWNYTIAEIASRDIELEYNREYRAEIRVKKNRAALYIDGKKLMEAEAPEDLASGKIGFSNRNAILKIADVKVYSGRKLVFEDDFSKDSIKRFRVQATTMPKEEHEKRQKVK
ncbi:MAG TPA: hypothetical protein VLM75_11445 [Spirochaetota bacterium]|nr:hypothetical protein [Spirochaetota bacterium]